MKNTIKRSLPLHANISMSKNHSIPDDTWQSIEDSNSPEHNEALCPLFYTEEVFSSPVVYDKKGNSFYTKDGYICKNNQRITPISNLSFTRTKTGIQSPLFEYYNGSIYTGVHTGDSLTIYKDGEVYKTLPQSNDVLTERIYHGDYFAFTKKDETYYFTGFGETYTVPVIDDISSPKIFIHEDIACIVLKTGVGISDNEAWMYNKDGLITPKAFSTTGTIPINQTTLIDYFTNHIYIETRLEQQTKVCRKIDDKYYDEDVEITFTPGYTPTYVSNDIYRYTVYTMTYTYSLTSSSDCTAHKNITVDDFPFPEPNNTFDVSFDNNNTYTLVLENNLGFQNSAELLQISLELTNTNAHATTTSLYPTEAITINRNRGYDVQVKYTYTTGGTDVTPSYFSTRGIMLDDGYFYPFQHEDSIPSSYKGYNFKNTITDTEDFTVTPYKPYNKSSTYGKSVTACMDVGYGHYREVLLYNKNTSDLSASNAHVVVYDSLVDEMFDYAGLTYNTDGTFQNLAGSKEKGDGFTLLVNNGFTSGISYNSTLLTSWNTVDTESPVFTSSSYAYYRDVYTKEWIILQVEEKPADVRIIENRLIVFNTTSFLNAYDTTLNKPTHFASDWNDRVFFGDRYTENKCIENYTHGSAYNANYDTINQDEIIASTTFPAYNMQYVSPYAYAPLDEDLEVQMYEANSIAVPKYVASYKDIKAGWYTNKTIDADLQYYNVSYPLYNSSYIRRSPSFFADFILSGNNQDYMIDGGIGFQVLYEGVKPMLLTKTTGDIYGMTSVFVIQSMPYSVIDGKIYSLSYLNGVYQGMDCIIDVTGMVYVGSVPTKAFFYSPNNRAIYCFFGDANLTKVQDASVITDIYYTTYNTSTQTIYMATNDGLYMISDSASFKQRFYNVQSISFLEDGSSIVVHKTPDYTATHFYYEDAEGRTTNKVIYDSGLKGAGEHKVFTIDKYNISLFSDQKRNGKIQIKSYVLRDNGQIDEEYIEKDVKTTDWDNTFLSTQVDVTPNKNRGVGVGISLISDFAITNITASATVENNTQAASSSFKI